ncbi:MAG: multicopper oxidase domain-containing protein [Chromatiales bacterium]|jgi:FtsP/CotA-like multicopper oxidase with cupredoxin domain
MNRLKKSALTMAVTLALLGGTGTAYAVVNVQCPGDDGSNGGVAGDAVIDDPSVNPNAKCMHLIAGDSFVNMSDGNPIYTFGFGDQTGTAPGDVIAEGILDAEWPGPTIELDEGDEFYLSLTNVGTVIRPDLFDPHTVHFHGFPNAASVFDGVPEVSISINMGATLTYYYNIVQPGTFMYHCHVEATEHMEMGMLANLYVHPAQDVSGCSDPLVCPAAGRKGGPGGGTDIGQPVGYTYNDDDGTTGWDVEKAIQLGDMDSEFHDASLFVQPLPFALMEGDYPMINGRGYPDTVISGALPAPKDDADGKVTGVPCTDSHTDPASTCEPINNGTPTQNVDSVISVPAGKKLLLRLSNLSVDRFYTLTAQGLTMQVVGTGAKHMRGVDGKNIYVETSSVNIGGGEAHDILIDTAGVTPGTYFLYAADLHQMSNLTQLDGGMITEIVVQ